MARFRSIVSKLWPASTAKKIAVLLVFVFLAFSGGFFAISEQTGFCNSCHIMNPYYASWQQSKHSEVNCLECHVQPGLAGLAKAKLNGLAQAVDYFLDRAGPKPNALVEDVSCLRDGCHTKESLLSEPVGQADQKYKFSHRGHIDAQLGGIRLLCATCHSRFEGDEHFKVNTQDCFICHFLKAQTSPAHLVETKCLDCHDVPAEVFKQGLAEIDHRKFVASQLSCEQLCHTRQIDPNNRVADVRCLDCHEFRNQGKYVATDLHAMHNGKDKVECLACHEMMAHGKSPIDGHHTSRKCDQCHAIPFEGARLAEIDFIELPAECGLCHNDPHAGQFTKACQQCHSEHGWNGRWVANVHGEGAAFPLADKHKSVECARCHTGVKLAQARFVGLLRTCEQCHPDPHEGQMSLSCDKCHNEQGFQRPWVKDHHLAESAFPLRGKHAFLQCRQCHNQQLKAQDFAGTDVNEIAGNCLNCHQDLHQGQMQASCSTCHSETGWKGSNLLFSHNQQASFKLEGPHSVLACDACHGQQDKRYRPVAHECGDCHQEQALAMQGIAQTLKGDSDFHDGRLSCTDCHNAGDARQPLSEFTQKCTSCHSTRYGELPYAWSTSFDKNRARAERILREIPDPNDERRVQIERMMGEAREIGFHNLRFTQQLWKEIADVQQGKRLDDETSLLLRK